MPESKRKERGQNWSSVELGWGGGGGLFSKIGAGGTVQIYKTEVRGRRDNEDPEVEQEVQRYIGARL